MNASGVIDLYSTFTAAGIVVWIDGGWGVDALLGRQTRAHDDLDIVIQENDVPAMREILAARGYADVPRDDSHRWNFVLGDAQGRQVDVHVVVLDTAGEVIDGLAYPSDSLTGAGTIAGSTVRCIDPGHLIKFHSGYPIREKDRLDVAALCQQFSIPLPAQYRAPNCGDH